MSNTEIRELINEKQQKLEKIIFVNKFVLNDQVQLIQDEIEELQSQCNHEFVDGVCIYCDRQGEN